MHGCHPSFQRGQDIQFSCLSTSNGRSDKQKADSYNNEIEMWAHVTWFQQLNNLTANSIMKHCGVTSSGCTWATIAKKTSPLKPERASSGCFGPFVVVHPKKIRRRYRTQRNNPSFSERTATQKTTRRERNSLHFREKQILVWPVWHLCFWTHSRYRGQTTGCRPRDTRKRFEPQYRKIAHAHKLDLKQKAVVFAKCGNCCKTSQIAQESSLSVLWLTDSCSLQSGFHTRVTGRAPERRAARRSFLLSSHATKDTCLAFWMDQIAFLAIFTQHSICHTIY